MKFTGMKTRNGFRTRMGKFNPFNERVCFFAEPDGGDGGAGGGEGDKGGKGKTFDWKDPEGKIYKLPDSPEIRDAITKSSLWGRKDATQKMQKQVDELNHLLKDKTTSLEQIQNKMREIEEAGMSDPERFKKQQERMRLETEQKIKGLTDSASQWEQRYTETEIKNTLLGALGKYELNNPAQTMMIIKQLGNARVIKDEKDGSFKVVMDAKGLNLPDTTTGGILEGELSPQEAIEKFLALTENAHHLKNNLRAGSGASQTGGGKLADGTLTYSRAKMATDPKLREEYNKKLLAHEKVALVE